ncbi:ankyrin [Daldinia bambusicola]|nr:ankyrin [Daldinia bambusicola]
MQQEDTHLRPAKELTTPTLSGDIIFAIAKYLREIRAIARLSETCRFYHELLDTFLYKADVFRTRRAYLQGSQVVASDTMELMNTNWITPSPGVETGTHGVQDAVVEKTALHWAITQADDRTRMAVARKSIKAVLMCWPECFELADSFALYMTPLQLAAKHGVEDVVRELTEAYGPVDMKISLNACDYFYSNKRHNLGPMLREIYFTAIPLSIAIIYGHVGVAETLARLTSELEECDRERGVLSPLRLAAGCRMPSVIEILQSRGFKVGRHRFYAMQTGRTPLHFAASVDNNEETLQLLLDTGYGLDYVSDRGWTAFETALELKCPANAVFLVKGLSVEEKMNIVNRNLVRLLGRDDLLPVTKALLEGNRIPRKQARRHKFKLRKYINIPRRLKNGANTINFILNHPNINFSRSMQERFLTMANKAVEEKKALQQAREEGMADEEPTVPDSPRLILEDTDTDDDYDNDYDDSDDDDNDDGNDYDDSDDDDNDNGNDYDDSDDDDNDDDDSDDGSLSP